MFDYHMSLEKFVTAKCQSVTNHLRAISKIRHFLDDESLKTLIQTLVMSRLDYCNSLLSNVNKTFINHLQIVQNAATRLITRDSQKSY